MLVISSESPGITLGCDSAVHPAEGLWNRYQTPRVRLTFNECVSARSVIGGGGGKCGSDTPRQQILAFNAKP